MNHHKFFLRSRILLRKTFSISNILALLTLLLAGFMRLYRIQDYMTFLGDEGRDVLVVYNILHGKPTLLGPTASVGGFFLGPIYYYFMAPFLFLFNYNPVGPAVMVALFGVATVWLIYKVGSEFLGRGVGLIAAFLYSISPLVVAHSRSSWNPNLMPFFSLLTLYVLYKAVSRNRAKLFILCGILIGIAMQLHYLATFLGVIVVIYVLLSRSRTGRVWTVSEHSENSDSQNIRQSENRKSQKDNNSEYLVLRSSDRSDSQSIQSFLKHLVLRVFKDYFYIFLGFIVGWSPFLAFEIRHGFPNIQSIISFIFNSGDTGSNNRFASTIYNVFFRLFARLVTNFPPPEQVSIRANSEIAVWFNLTIVLAVACSCFLLYKFVKSFKNKEQFQKISLLVLWLVVGIGLFGFYKKPIYDYYFGFMFPLPFMLVGLTISRFYTNLYKLTRIRPIGKIVAIAIFVGLAWVNLKGIPFLSPANRQLAQVETISKFVINKTENKPFNFALITGGNSDHAYRYFFTLWEKQPVTIENPKKDPQRKTVTNQLLVVCEDASCHPLGHSLWEIAGFGRAEIVNEWNVSVVKVYKLKHYEGE